MLDTCLQGHVDDKHSVPIRREVVSTESHIKLQHFTSCPWEFQKPRQAKRCIAQCTIHRQLSGIVCVIGCSIWNSPKTLFAWNHSCQSTLLIKNNPQHANVKGIDICRSWICTRLWLCVWASFPLNRGDATLSYALTNMRVLEPLERNICNGIREQKIQGALSDNPTSTILQWPCIASHQVIRHGGMICFEHYVQWNNGRIRPPQICRLPGWIYQTQTNTILSTENTAPDRVQSCRTFEAL